MDWSNWSRTPMEADYLNVLIDIGNRDLKSLIEVVKETYRQKDPLDDDNTKYKNYFSGVKRLLKNINEKTGRIGILYEKLSGIDGDGDPTDDLIYYYIWTILLRSTDSFNDELTPGIIANCLERALGAFLGRDESLDNSHNYTGLMRALMRCIRDLLSLGGGTIKRKSKRRNSKRRNSKQGKSKRSKSKRNKSKRNKSKRGKSNRNKSKPRK